MQNGYIAKPVDLDLLFKVAAAIKTFWIAIAQLTFAASAAATVGA